MYDMCSDGHRLRFDDVAIHTQLMILIMDQWYMMHEHCHSTHDPDHSLLILLLVSLVCYVAELFDHLLLASYIYILSVYS